MSKGNFPSHSQLYCAMSSSAAGTQLPLLGGEGEGGTHSPSPSGLTESCKEKEEEEAHAHSSTNDKGL